MGGGPMAAGNPLPTSGQKSMKYVASSSAVRGATGDQEIESPSFAGLHRLSSQLVNVERHLLSQSELGYQILRGQDRLEELLRSGGGGNTSQPASQPDMDNRGSGVMAGFHQPLRVSPEDLLQQCTVQLGDNEDDDDEDKNGEGSSYPMLSSTSADAAPSVPAQVDGRDVNHKPFASRVPNGSFVSLTASKLVNSKSNFSSMFGGTSTQELGGDLKWASHVATGRGSSPSRSALSMTVLEESPPSQQQQHAERSSPTQQQPQRSQTQTSQQQQHQQQQTATTSSWKKKQPPVNPTFTTWEDLRQDFVARRIAQAQKSTMEKGLEHRGYECFMFALISLNSIFIGVQVQVAAPYVFTSDLYEEPIWYFGLECLFCVLFIADLTARLYIYRLRFFIGNSAAWNWLDFIVVFLMVLEQAARSLAESESPMKTVASLRIIRAARVIRAVRILHVLKFLHGLRTLLQTVVVAFKSMIWTSFVVLMLLYVFGVALCQGVLDLCALDGGCANEDHLVRDFGSVGDAILSLFKAMTNGVSWGDYMDQIARLPAYYGVVFVLYIGVAYFAVLNVVTGIFVETTLQVASKDREKLVEEEMREKELYAKHVYEIFFDMDLDQSGQVSIEEFREALQDSRIMAYFNALQLDFMDIMTLFVLLDRDQNGSVDLEEFVKGCMRLRGEARSLDLVQLQYEVEWLVHNLALLMSDVEDLKVMVDTPENEVRVHPLWFKKTTTSLPVRSTETTLDKRVRVLTRQKSNRSESVVGIQALRRLSRMSTSTNHD